MGSKGLEVGFELNTGQERYGWLVFQLDMKLMQESYGLDEDGLQRFHITEPS